MKFLIAPDSFKESLSAAEVASAIKMGFESVLPEAKFQLLPMADGGEGTCEALVAATGGELFEYQVTGPLGGHVDAALGILGSGKTAVIEMATAAGLDLVVPEARNPAITTTYGVGELILKALDHDIRHIVIGLGAVQPMMLERACFRH